MSPFAQMRTKEEQLDANYVRERLDYAHSTGKFYWKPRAGADLPTIRWNGRFAGVQAGSVKHGYTIIGLDGRVYSASRLAHLYMTGEWPDCLMSHQSRVSSNDCWSELREATHSELAAYSKKPRTNTSGFKGVSDLNGKWGAQIGKDKQHIFLWLYDTPEAAAQAYNGAAVELHGEFANGNLLERLPAELKRRPAHHSNTGVRGVSRLADGGYRAATKSKGKNIFLGNFTTLEAATRAYRNATQPRDTDEPSPQRRPRRLSKSGFCGVRQRGSKFISRITIAEREVHLGTFNTREEAAEAYVKAKAGRQAERVGAAA
jgi:hypothetical protein